jgi:hypothetical protein
MNAAPFEKARKVVTTGNSDHEKVLKRRAGHGDSECPEPCFVSTPDVVAFSEPVVQVSQLHPKHRGLQIIHSRCDLPGITQGVSPVNLRIAEARLGSLVVTAPPSPRAPSDFVG